MREKTFGLVLRLFACSAAATAGVLLFIGCDSGGGGGGGASGDATVVGNVASFSAGGTAFIFEPEPRGFGRRLLAGLADALVPAAEAAAGGVTVSIVGTGLSDTTDGGGYFAFSGVPPGRREFMFTHGAHSGILVVDVPSASTLELRNVRVNDQAVTVDDLLVQVSETVTTAAGGGGGGGGGSSSDGSGSSVGTDDGSGDDDASGGDDGEDDENEDDD